MFREKIKNIKQEIKNIKGQIELHQDQKMLQPNVPLETVPKGANEKDNLFHEIMVYPVRETGVHHGDMGQSVLDYVLEESLTLTQPVVPHLVEEVKKYY